jgi:hypothetical protein
MEVQHGSTVAIYRLHNTYNSVRREVLYTVTQFCTPIKLVLIIKICLNKIYSKVYTDKHWFDTFPTQNGQEIIRCFIEIVFETGGIC